MPAPHFPKYPFGDSVIGEEDRDTDSVEQLGDFDDILEGAHQEGVIDIAPVDKFSADNARAHEIRNRTIATRLWLLGYLQTKPGKDQSAEDIFSDTFKEAVKRFQQEAGLTVDGWVGDESWHALDALVSFESDIREEPWYKNNEPRSALERAVQLRLFSLGLFGSKPEPGFTGLPEGAMDEFRKINSMFKLTGRYLRDGADWDTVRALFDQDNIVEKLSEAGSSNNGAKKSFTIFRPSNLKRKKANALANRFIINAAKVELWLLGFNVTIDGKDDYSISSRALHGRNKKLYGALSLYYRELRDMKRRKAEKLAKSITPALFVSMQEVHRRARHMDGSTMDEDYSLEIAESEDLNSDEKIETAWGAVRTRSVSLWDGIKRLWRWIVRGIKKIISFFKNNIFKAFFRYATKAYKIVKTAISSVVNSIEYMLKGVLKGSSPETAVVWHDADFDQTVFVNRDADPEKLSALTRRQEIQTALFQLGTAILGFIFTTFKRIVTGMFGWARLLSSLVKNLKEIKPLYRRLKKLTGSIG
jgi:peptidoglycan hydrolase-like protein with peptidoglycan-binding domain